MALYVEALTKEIAYYGARTTASVATIYFGGGTPTVLGAEKLCKLLQAIRQHFTLQPDCEITLEANPATMDRAGFLQLREAGFHRLSIGLQSTEDDLLKLLGRIHTYQQFLQCYQDARAAGFANINIDVMAALPGQSVAGYAETLKKVIALEPEHISSYSLILEEGTRLYEIYSNHEGGADQDACSTYDHSMSEVKKDDGGHPACLTKDIRWGACGDMTSGAQTIAPHRYPPLPTEEEDREMYHLTKTMLAEAGYDRYEISNYAKPGFSSRHNSSYWQRISYIGMGLGASGFCAGAAGGSSENVQQSQQQSQGQESKGQVSQRQSLQQEKSASWGVRYKNTSDIDCYVNRWRNNNTQLHATNHNTDSYYVNQQPDIQQGTNVHTTITSSVEVATHGTRLEISLPPRDQLLYFDELDSLTKNDAMSEFLFLGLRMSEGVSVADFYRQFDCSIWDIFGDALHSLAEQQLLQLVASPVTYIRLTDRGMDLSNYVFRRLII